MVASMQPSFEYITSDLPGRMSEKLDPQGGSTGSTGASSVIESSFL